jgi:hypothetical protein
MLTLVFSKEQKIREAVTQSYRSMYLDDVTTTSEKTKMLLELVGESSLTELTCIEEMVSILGEEKQLEQIFYELWSIYQQK